MDKHTCTHTAREHRKYQVKNHMLRVFGLKQFSEKPTCMCERSASLGKQTVLLGYRK